jgi:hypothetical protein
MIFRFRAQKASAQDKIAGDHKFTSNETASQRRITELTRNGEH